MAGDVAGGGQGRRPLAAVPSLSIVAFRRSIALPLLPSQTSWRLAGVASHVRYVERAEKTQLAAVQAGLGRPEATCAALIPIKKSAAWWELTQEERRRIFEDKSHHIAASLKYLPAIARQLYHCRDLGEPFDFLTWFEYAPEHVSAVRGTGGDAARHRGMELCRARGRCAAGAGSAGRGVDSLVPRTLRSAKCCAAEPGPTTDRKRGSRLCGAAQARCAASGTTSGYFSRNRPEAIRGRPVTGQL